ncbi:hypothetical protein LINPERHAP2_LOCUS24129 [Linum perenne]
MFIERLTTRQITWQILVVTRLEELTRCIMMIVIWLILSAMIVWEFPNPE